MLAFAIQIRPQVLIFSKISAQGKIKNSFLKSKRYYISARIR